MTGKKRELEKFRGIHLWRALKRRAIFYYPVSYQVRHSDAL